MPELHCDIGKQVRGWLLGLDDVAQWLGDDQRVVDTIDEHSCFPLIWFSRRATRNTDTLAPCGALPEEVTYDLEVIDHERNLNRTRYIAECIRLAAEQHDVGVPFGFPDSDLYIQLIDVVDANDDYQPMAAPFIPGCCWTAIRMELTPV